MEKNRRKTKPKRKIQTREQKEKKEKMKVLDVFVEQIEHVANTGKDVDKLLEVFPRVIEELIILAGKRPVEFLIFYSRLLKIIKTNTPGILSNLSVIDENMSPEMTYRTIDEGIKKALRNLPYFTLSSIFHPGKTVDLVFSSVLHTVIFLIDLLQTVMHSMMEDEMNKTMSAIKPRGRGRY